MTASAPQQRYWTLTTEHPTTGDPIGYTWPAPIPLEIAVSITQALCTTFSVTSLTWPLDDGSNLVAAVVLFTLAGTQKLTCIAATDVDDAHTRLVALAQTGTLVPLA